jgi:hypothetical protein
MPEIDAQRWRTLCERAQELRSVRKALFLEQQSIQERLVAASTQVGILEGRFTRRYGELPACAQLSDYQSLAPRSGQAWRHSGADDAKALIAARLIVQDLSAQAQRLEERLAPGARQAQ